jgi:hypothetical protein
VAVLFFGCLVSERRGRWRMLFFHYLVIKKMRYEGVVLSLFSVVGQDLARISLEASLKAFKINSNQYSVERNHNMRC